jgi:hypothetical protein
MQTWVVALFTPFLKPVHDMTCFYLEALREYAGGAA